MLIAMIAGNLGGDAETRAVADTKVTTFSVASTRKQKSGDVTTWVRCNMWGDRGEKLREYLRKGTPVTVHGELSTNEYVKEGETKFSLELRVNDVKLQGSKKKEEGNEDDIPF